VLTSNVRTGQFMGGFFCKKGRGSGGRESPAGPGTPIERPGPEVPQKVKPFAYLDIIF